MMKFSDKPLTLEELESYYVESEYIGQIALIQNNGTKALAILDHRDDDGMCAVFAASGRYLKEKDYGKTWWAFPYVENEIDREKWEPCRFCSNADFGEYGFEFGKKYAKIACALGSWRFPKDEQFQFCPECGRPLTEESWELLEKRLRR